ncbi:hypothetical protein APHMUC_1108 [Anaplasma phagocytophilum str. ApMUC09]|uniref:Uncharacterized protein n=1 Tax=Anaplasma phagocytophilum str. ApMUC09 TaxID=1359152 RepID=A0A0F3N7U2_ANAPH|nr:hypothetical protein APHMUC_1108 [Anaplasma phagocytophilum str. ApMUC09]
MLSGVVTLGKKLPYRGSRLFFYSRILYSVSHSYLAVNCYP